MCQLTEMPTMDISTETGTNGPSRRSGTVASDVPLAVPPSGLQGGVLRLPAGSPPRTGAPSQASGGGDPASERAVMERCAAECLHVASGGESAVASGAASIRSVSQPASAPDETELSSTTDVRQASASRLSASASRLRLFSLGSSQPLLDVSADDFEWPDDEGCRDLTVQDALELLPNDNLYRTVCKTGELRVMGEDEELVWGSSYQVVSSHCPACTVCGLSCARSASAHVLCTHGVSEGSVHLWHDLRQRPLRLQGRLRKYIAIQIYMDGVGLGTELSEEEITVEVMQIATEVYEDAQSDHEKEQCLSRMLAWENRVAPGAVRQAIAAARRMLSARRVRVVQSGG